MEDELDEQVRSILIEARKACLSGDLKRRIELHQEIERILRARKEKEDARRQIR